MNSELTGLLLHDRVKLINLLYHVIVKWAIPLDIYKIEAEIQQILTTDKKSWIRVYELICLVEADKSWRDNFPSFSSWIRHLAAISKVHESVIWQRKKAGEIYKKYQTREKANGRGVLPLEKVRVSPSNLILAEKIGQGVPAATDSLINKIIQGDLKRSELNAAWQSVKRVREANGEVPNATTRHDKIKPDEVALVASDISIALTNSDWLRGLSDTHNTTSNKFEKRIYRATPEFPAVFGLTGRSEKIDLLVVENITLRKAHRLNTHAIKIKVSVSDIMNDKSVSGYADLVDFMWIAVSANLKDLALRNAKASWGVIVVNDQNEAEVVRKAVRQNPIIERKLDLMQAFVIREC